MDTPTTSGSMETIDDDGPKDALATSNSVETLDDEGSTDAAMTSGTTEALEDAESRNPPRAVAAPTASNLRLHLMLLDPSTMMDP